MICSVSSWSRRQENCCKSQSVSGPPPALVGLQTMLGQTWFWWGFAQREHKSLCQTMQVCTWSLFLRGIAGGKGKVTGRCATCNWCKIEPQRIQIVCAAFVCLEHPEDLCHYVQAIFQKYLNKYCCLQLHLQIKIKTTVNQGRKLWFKSRLYYSNPILVIKCWSPSLD